tara:strand:+ start:172 stop:378 length:207 start_codon:yes stop_codon:yes gene_type:complete
LSERRLFSKVALVNLARGLFFLHKRFLEWFSQRIAIGHEKAKETRDTSIGARTPEVGASGSRKHSVAR